MQVLDEYARCTQTAEQLIGPPGRHTEQDEVRRTRIDGQLCMRTQALLQFGPRLTDLLCLSIKDGLVPQRKYTGQLVEGADIVR